MSQKIPINWSGTLLLSISAFIHMYLYVILYYPDGHTMSYRFSVSTILKPSTSIHVYLYVILYFFGGRTSFSIYKVIIVYGRPLLCMEVALILCKIVYYAFFFWQPYICICMPSFIFPMAILYLVRSYICMCMAYSFSVSTILKTSPSIHMFLYDILYFFCNRTVFSMFIP